MRFQIGLVCQLRLIFLLVVALLLAVLSANRVHADCERTTRHQFSCPILALD